MEEGSRRTTEGEGAAKEGVVMAEMKEFLNPKSMLTPGVAGAVTMLISNTLWFQFELPQKWTALTVSFLLGLIVVAADLPVWQRLAYWVINSLIIFSVGAGTSAVGHGIGKADTRSGLEGRQRIVSYLGVGTAFAHEGPPEWVVKVAAASEERGIRFPGRGGSEIQRRQLELQRQREQLQREKEELQRQKEEFERRRDAAPQQSPRQFFDRWF
jgi:hypothetical protein